MNLKMRWFQGWTWGVALVLVVLGCGKTQQAAAPSGPAGPAGEGGTAGSSPEPGPLGGDGGAPPTSEPGYGASLFDAVPLPPAPSGVLDGTERVQQEMMPVWVSEDGSLIIGDSFTTFVRPDGTRVYEDSQGFVWTERHGVRPLLLPLGGELLNACVAADGSSALLTTFDEPPNKPGAAYRWTEEGLEALSLPVGVPGLALQGCDAALSHASFTRDNRAYVWSQSDSSIQNVSAPPDATASDVFVSRQGKLSVANVVARDGTVPYRFDFDTGSLSALGDPERDCAALALSDDGAQVIGSCASNPASPGLNRVGFHYDGDTWTDLGLLPQFLAGDGAIVWGERNLGAPTHDLAAWHSSSGELIPCQLGAQPWQLVGISADGANAFVNVGSTTAEEALRCAATGGAEPLPLLPGQARAYVTGVSRDGAIQVGDQTAGSTGPTLPVVWDAQGARDVLAELKTARVELAAERIKLRRVWHDAAEIRILGEASVGNESTVGILIRLRAR